MNCAAAVTRRSTMHSRRLGQSLAVAVTISLALLLGIALALAAIRQGAVVPPDLEVSLSGLHIVASITDPHECRIALPCRDSYVVWVFYKNAPDDVAGNGRRILVVPLKR